MHYESAMMDDLQLFSRKPTFMFLRGYYSVISISDVTS